MVLADGHHQIIYVNDTAQSDVRAQPARNPQDAADVRCAPAAWLDLESLSTDPSQQRRVLDNLVGSDMQERLLGACTFRTVSNPVSSDRGERIGTVIEWTDRTQEVAVEKEMQNMLAAVISGDLGKRIDLSGKTASSKP